MKEVCPISTLVSVDDNPTKREVLILEENLEALSVMP